MELTRQWLDLVARSGTALFISADPATLAAAQKPALKAALAEAANQRPGPCRSTGRTRPLRSVGCWTARPCATTGMKMTDREEVDPALVPKRTLYTGATMPAIGLGTFGSDHVPPEEIAAAVTGAVLAGYRHLDCASVYGNEERIGAAFDGDLRRRNPARRVVDYLEALERQARRIRRNSRLPEIAGGTCAWTIWICTWCVGRSPIFIPPG